jgi:putative RecB family exonuclease
VKLPRPLSHSSITLYNECPQKFKFKYVDKIPEKPKHFFSFGQSVHLALEWFYGGTVPVAPKLEDLLKHYREIWVKPGYRDENQEADYFEEGRQILTRFHDKHAKSFHVPFSVEYNFNFEHEGIPLTGKVDRIDELPDGRLSILDYKTGKKLAAGRLDIDAQLTMYQFAAESQLGKEVGELIFYHLPTLKEHRTIRRDKPLVKELTERIVATAEGITKDRFDPKPTENACRWCDYKPICPIYKDQYAGMPAPIAKPSGEPELAALVDKYGDALAKIESAKAEAVAAAAELSAALKKKNYVRAFGDRFEVSSSPAVKWEFQDKKKVLEMLKKAGVYEQVLAPSAPLVNKLIEDKSTDADLRARLTEIGERVETTDLKLKGL